MKHLFNFKMLMCRSLARVALPSSQILYLMCANFTSIFQILMSVMPIITATLMLTVPTLLVASTVPVTQDTLEVGSHVGVSGGKMQMNCNIGQRLGTSIHFLNSSLMILSPYEVASWLIGVAVSL